MKISDIIENERITDYRKNKSKTHVVLTKSGGAILFSSLKDGNSLPFVQIKKLCMKEIDPELQDDYTDIAAKANGFLLRRSRSLESLLAGDRNRYSKDLNAPVRALLDRGVAHVDSPIWLGDTSELEGEMIGSINHVLSRSFPPKLLQLYHGTSSKRLPDIKRHGLVPLPIEDRVWNDGDDITVRADAIYLTAVRAQAEYYAGITTKNDNNRTETFKPVILEIILHQSDYKRLIADDDYLSEKDKGEPTNWQSSLSFYGQVAYRGQIPVNQIRVIARGDGAGQISQ